MLNIVKLRYLDPPIFVDVGSIVASHSLEQNATFGRTVTNPNSWELGVSGTYTDSPTVTFTPLTGNQFIKDLMTPLPPESVFFCIQAGMPADTILFSAVAAINGLKNQEVTFNGVSPADPEFHRVRALLREIQASGAVRTYVRHDSETKETDLIAFRTNDVAPQTLEDIKEVRRLLRLNPDATEFKIISGGTASNDTELAVLTRSVLSLMKTMAAQVEVPPEDLKRSYATPGFEQGADVPGAVRLIRIHSAKERPADAFVTVRYEGAWFWIDKGDLHSKQVFSLMMLLFTMADSGTKESGPVVTIPAH